MSRQKYHFRKLTPDEFRDLMKRAGVSVRDFLYFTGRRQDALSEFLNDKARGDRRAYTPTMGDVQLLELAAHYPKLTDAMHLISQKYSLPEGDTNAEPDRT